MLISVQTASILGIQGIDKGFRMIAEAGFYGVDLTSITALAVRPYTITSAAAFSIRPMRKCAQP